MPDRKVYQATPNPETGWRVKAESASRASSNCQTKDKAIEHAKELAKSADKGQVIIHKNDGMA